MKEIINMKKPILCHFLVEFWHMLVFLAGGGDDTTEGVKEEKETSCVLFLCFLLPHRDCKGREE